MFYIFYAFIWLLMWLPLPVLYLFSDFFYLILYYVVGYRKKVVRSNLKNSFPDKSTKELRKIERRFFRYFCDLFVETMYEVHMSEEEALRRIDFGNIDFILKQYDQGKSIMLMTAHYCNWEWITAFSLQLPKGKRLYGIYKELKNKKFDAFIYDLRTKYTGGNIEKAGLLRSMLRKRNEGEVAMYGMISDQTPSVAKIRLWTPFLNQMTPTMLGTEELAKKFDYPVVFLQVNRIKRGYYRCEVIPITESPRQTEEAEITKTYLNLLEQAIQEAPEYWLWTHKRWKHKYISN